QRALRGAARRRPDKLWPFAPSRGGPQLLAQGRRPAAGAPGAAVAARLGGAGLPRARGGAGWARGHPWRRVASPVVSFMAPPPPQRMVSSMAPPLRQRTGAPLVQSPTAPGRPGWRRAAGLDGSGAAGRRSRPAAPARRGLRRRCGAGPGPAGCGRWGRRRAHGGAVGRPFIGRTLEPWRGRGRGRPAAPRVPGGGGGAVAGPPADGRGGGAAGGAGGRPPGAVPGRVPDVAGALGPRPALAGGLSHGAGRLPVRPLRRDRRRAAVGLRRLRGAAVLAL